MLGVSLSGKPARPTSVSQARRRILPTLAAGHGDSSPRGSIRSIELGDHDRLLKSTISLCPDCLARVPALVFTRNGRVLA